MFRPAAILPATAIVAATLITSPALANTPEYNGYRKWIEENNPKDTTPVAQRLFIGYSNEWSSIARWSKGKTLRDVVDATKARGNSVHIMVLRSNSKNPVYDAIIGPKDKPGFELHPLDVVCLSDPLAPE